MLDLPFAASLPRMDTLWALCRRDLIFLFTTPLAWLVLAAWTAVTGLAFYFGGLEVGFGNTGSPEPLYVVSLSWGATLLTLLAPAITMNSFAAEHTQHTMQLLLTVPIKEWSLVGGKFLAAFLMLLTLLASTLVQPLILTFVSDPGGWQLFSGYLGMTLLCAFFAALGIWISLLVDHPIATYVLTFGLIAVLQILGFIGSMDQGIAAAIGRHIGLSQHIQGLLRGDLRLEHICYFVAGTATFLTLAHGALMARRIHG